MKRTKNEGAQHAFELKTKKSLGQHFLKDNGVIADIVAAVVALCKESGTGTCVEIGPGSGALTTKLLAAGLRVIAIEKDDRAVEGLRATLLKQHPGQFGLVQSDILMLDPTTLHLSKQPKPVLVGNLPYYITSDIMLWHCRWYENFFAAVFMVQDEVADRIAAKTQTKDYGRLSVRMQLYFDVKKLFVVPPRAFVPPPKVNSAVIGLRDKGFSFTSLDEDVAFSQFTAKMFGGRRKMIRRVLSDTIERLKHKNREAEFWQTIHDAGFDEASRPDVLPPGLILKMHKIVYESAKNST